MKNNIQVRNANENDFKSPISESIRKGELITKVDFNEVNEIPELINTLTNKYSFEIYGKVCISVNLFNY